MLHSAVVDNKIGLTFDTLSAKIAWTVEWIFMKHKNCCLWTPRKHVGFDSICELSVEKFIRNEQMNVDVIVLKLWYIWIDLAENYEILKCVSSDVRFSLPLTNVVNQDTHVQLEIIGWRFGYNKQSTWINKTEINWKTLTFVIYK